MRKLVKPSRSKCVTVLRVTIHQIKACAKLKINLLNRKINSRNLWLYPELTNLFTIRYPDTIP